MIWRDTQPAVTGQTAVQPAPARPVPPLPAPAIRVCLLSDSALFRSGIRRLLTGDRSFAVSEIKAPPIREALRRNAPHVLVVDAHIPGALELCRDLRLNGVRPWVILAGADGDERWAVEALKAGVRGILTKSASVEHLFKAIRVVHQGEVWATSRVIAQTMAELASRVVTRPAGKMAFDERLSRREQEIVQLVVDGLSNLEVATRLGITEATVKAHLTHIFQKLALRGRSQLAACYHGRLSRDT
ncbi:MAG TPA: response regulator transcription factor [Methylomirabilota bacterium]|nr:response regulator transcription factor [Methylomirabilota bacterium]